MFAFWHFEYTTSMHRSIKQYLQTWRPVCGGWKAAAFWIAGRSCCDGFNLLPLSRSEDWRFPSKNGNGRLPSPLQMPSKLTCVSTLSNIYYPVTTSQNATNCWNPPIFSPQISKLLLWHQEIETLSHLKQWAWELKKRSRDWPAIIQEFWGKKHEKHGIHIVFLVFNTQFWESSMTGGDFLGHRWSGHWDPTRGDGAGAGEDGTEGPPATSRGPPWAA